jgi:hypothetical protein
VRPPDGWRLVQTCAGVRAMCSERCDLAWHPTTMQPRCGGCIVEA